MNDSFAIRTSLLHTEEPRPNRATLSWDLNYRRKDLGGVIYTFASDAWTLARCMIRLQASLRLETVFQGIVGHIQRYHARSGAVNTGGTPFMQIYPTTSSWTAESSSLKRNYQFFKDDS